MSPEIEVTQTSPIVTYKMHSRTNEVNQSGTAFDLRNKTDMSLTSDPVRVGTCSRYVDNAYVKYKEI